MQRLVERLGKIRRNKTTEDVFQKLQRNQNCMGNNTFL